MTSNFISTLTPTLPEGQDAIETSSVRKLYGFLRLVLKAADGRRPVIAIAHSERAGIGKTTAILAAVENILPESHAGQPNALLLQLEPDIAPMAFLELILDALEEQPQGRTKAHLRRSVIKAIQRNDVRLLVFDEADQFSRRTFEELRYIAGETGCPVILVGLVRILSVVKPYEALDSRSFRRLIFEELQEIEMLNTVFPKITCSGWKFDPAKPDDVALGKYIWKKVKPSLRLAYGIVETASDIAELKGDLEVTRKHVDEALKHIRLSGLPRRRGKGAKEASGSHEAKSEARNAAKRGKKEEEE